MIKATDLRIGNWIISTAYGEEKLLQVNNIGSSYAKYEDGMYLDLSICKGVLLTREILEACGFSKMPHYTIGGIMNIELGRDRFISISCVGSPNEMVFVTEEESPVVKNVLVVRNFDYDGKTYLHQLQNLFFCFANGRELPYNPK